MCHDTTLNREILCLKQVYYFEALVIVIKPLTYVVK